MYPYFQKKQAPSINSREAAPTDPLRQFLTQNSQFGTLLFQVTGGQGSVPIANATVVISKSLPNGYMLSITATTDESGKTEEFSQPHAFANPRHRRCFLHLSRTHFRPRHRLRRGA